jgi:hypothetical protein
MKHEHDYYSVGCPCGRELQFPMTDARRKWGVFSRCKACGRLVEISWQDQSEPEPQNVVEMRKAVSA